MPNAFLDFEASSLGKHGYPIEVGWVREDGGCGSHLIRPAPGWEDWSAEAEATHGIPRDRLLAEGVPHDAVARELLRALEGCAVHASAPSWDGHWLSLLLRAAGLPRHALRLRDTDTAQAEAAAPLAALGDAGRERGQAIIRAVRQADAAAGAPAHRALDDARRELRIWQEISRRVQDALRNEGHDGERGDTWAPDGGGAAPAPARR